jgi:WD40 repeat protein/serine/threonine protein kinase
MAEKPLEQSIFLHAVGLASPADRAAYLEDICRDNPRLRVEIDALFAAHDRLGADPPPSAPELPRTLDEPTTERPGTVIGPYKLLQQIGEGGMGTVFMAEQTEPVRRKVALKIIKPGMDSRQVIARFEAERQALSLMDHPNIARVLDAGSTAAGRPFFVMELVHGVPITEFCDDHKLTPRERLALFVPVCQAIQHAHQKGIIHRDLKPTNVLVTLYDDKPAPKVIDFGVAKATEQPLTEKALFTQFGALVGTFEYMSLEQAEMNAIGVDTRSDIYSLGVLLYELLTGTTPLERQRLRQAALDELVRLIKEEEAPRPSARLSSSNNLRKIAAARNTEPALLSKVLKGDIDWIVMKCLEKDRTRRYESASGLARDVQRALADEPVEACPPSAGYRLRKFSRKYRTLLRVAGAFLILLVLGVVASTWQAIRATVAERAARSSEAEAQNRKHEADEAKKLAENRRDALAAVNDTLRRAKYIADMNLAHHAWAESNPIRTRELLDQHVPRPGEPDLRGFEWHYLNRLFHGERQVWQAHNGLVAAIAFTANGKRLLSCGKTQPRRTMSTSESRHTPREIKLWDVATGRQLPLGLNEPTDKVIHLAVSLDGARLAAACGNQGVRLWDLTTGRQSTLPRHAQERDVYVGFSPDGKRLVAASLPDADAPELDCLTVRVWDLAGPRVVMTLEKLSSFAREFEFSPDGKLLAFADTLRGRVPVLDASTGREAFTCKYADGQVRHAVFSPDGTRLAACGEQGVQFWNVATREAVAAWPSASNNGEFLAYSPDGKRLAVATVEGAVELWDTVTKQRVTTFHGHAGILYMVAFSPDGTQLASAGVDGTVRLWDPTGRREVVPLSQSASDINHLDLSPDGKAILAYTPDTSIQFWDAATGEPRGDPIVKKGLWGGMSYCWTADGKRLFACNGQKQITVFDVSTGKAARTLAVDGVGPSGVLAVSSDGKWCAHAAPGGIIKVRDAVTGAESQVLQGFNDPYYLIFSPDGSRLLGVDNGSRLKIWDRATGRETAATRLSDVYIIRVLYSADGKRLAVVGLQHRSIVGDVRVLDAQTGRELAALKGHTLLVGEADFSPDGQRLATCSADRTVRLWDLASGQEILTLRGHTRHVGSVRFISDGNRLISASGDRTVRVWDATPLPE